MDLILIVYVCVSVFFLANMTVMSSLPSHNIKKNFFFLKKIMRWVKLKCFTFDCMQCYVSECCETPRIIFVVFFLSIIYFDTMQ